MKKLFDNITFGALKIEMVVMVFVMVACLFKATTTFML